MIRVVVINENGAEVREIEDSLEVFYDIIGCDLIDITVREVKGIALDFIVDDEGLLKDDPVARAISLSHPSTDVLVGNIIVSQANEEGEQISLTDKEVEAVISRMGIACNPATDTLYDILVMD